MKICWDNLEGFYLSKKGNLRKGTNTYVEANSCKFCDEPYLALSNNDNGFCSIRCSSSGEYNSNYGKPRSEKTKRLISNSNKNSHRNWKRGHPMLGKKHSEASKIKMSKSTKGQSAGENNYFWNGGVTKDKVSLYVIYNNRLSFFEDTKIYTDSRGRELLQVRCTKCNKWYVPSPDSIRHRVDCVNGIRSGEGRFYCSQGCKNSCEIYGKHARSYISIYDDLQYTNNELSIWSNEVLKRANYICEYCGSKATQSHHIQPKKLEPFLALDPENGVAVCKSCHFKYGHKDECSTIKLAHKKCREEV